MFSIPAEGAPVRSLMSSLPPSSTGSQEQLSLGALGVLGDGHLSSGLGGVSADAVVESVRVGRQVWFSVVVDSPFLAKRAQPGLLRPGDLGIALHTCLHVNADSKLVVLSSTPVSLQPSTSVAEGARHTRCRVDPHTRIA